MSECLYDLKNLFTFLKTELTKISFNAQYDVKNNFLEMNSIRGPFQE